VEIGTPQQVFQDALVSSLLALAPIFPILKIKIFGAMPTLVVGMLVFSAIHHAHDKCGHGTALLRHNHILKKP
jgi:hypothetical protein